MTREDVLGDTQLWIKAELLIDRGNPSVLRLTRFGKMNNLASHPNLSFVWRVHPRKDFNESRFASTILSQERVDLSRKDIKGYTAQRAHPRK